MAHLRQAGRESSAAAPESTNLPAAAVALLEEAHRNPAGRAARTLVPGPHLPLKQTLLALVSGESLAEHNAPQAAVLQVIAGRVRLVGGGDAWVLETGDLLPIPPVRHHVDALDDAVMLLTVGQ